MKPLLLLPLPRLELLLAGLYGSRTRLRNAKLHLVSLSEFLDSDFRRSRSSKRGSWSRVSVWVRGDDTGFETHQW